MNNFKRYRVDAGVCSVRQYMGSDTSAMVVCIPLENMYDIKVGDVVKPVKDHRDMPCAYDGSIGTVKTMGDCGVLVDFHHDVGGHSAGGQCKMNHGWYFRLQDLEKVTDGVCS